MLVGYAVVWKLVGLIPVNAGAGWDGAVYLEYLNKLVHGQRVEGDPYRLTRLPGFLPAAVALALGVGPDAVAPLQSVFNAVLLSAMAAVCYVTLAKRVDRPSIALCATGTLYFTWPYLVSPVYYPLLSDHPALALACCPCGLGSTAIKGRCCFSGFSRSGSCPDYF